MNARLPTFTLFTANAELDAARHEKDRENDDEWSQEAQRQAPVIVLAAIQNLKPTEWFKDKVSAGRSWAADEILQEAVMTDDDTCAAYTDLLMSPAGQKLRQCMANWFGAKHHLQVYADHLDAIERQQ